MDSEKREDPELGDAPGADRLGEERIDVWEAFWSQAAPADLPDELGEIARDRGMDVARYLAERWSGAQPYIKSKSTIIRDFVRERVEEEFTGFNAGALAERYGIDRQQVFRILRGDA